MPEYRIWYADKQIGFSIPYNVSYNMDELETAIPDLSKYNGRPFDVDSVLPDEFP